ncbi:MAG TPA: peptidoglycan-binding protein [Candidatus Paceibacterota bacterium]
MKKKTNILTGTATLVAFFAAAVIALGLALPYQAHAALLTQQLELGMRNPDVTSLQTFLAEDVTIYPQGLVTSYFGLLTKAAVSNFQSRNGIAAVGRVGPITLVAINNQMSGGGDTTEGAGKITRYNVPQPILSNITVSRTSNSATITWNSNVQATARVIYSTVWPFGYRNASSVTSSAGLSTAQSVTLSNLQSNTTYYYVVESLDSQGNFSWSANGVSFKTQ